ncbi:hypothetical protein PENTCL1PPCAC_7491, partial [Pristionchus entomophagus]
RKEPELQRTVETRDEVMVDQSIGGVERECKEEVKEEDKSKDEPMDDSSLDSAIAEAEANTTRNKMRPMGPVSEKKVKKEE